MVTIDQVNAFIAVYETQGYSGAARQLGKSRTTVRELVMTLEDHLNLILFDVDGRKVLPTAEAERLHFQARLLQSQLASFNELAGSIHAKEEEKFVILYDPMLNSSLMTDVTAKLSSKFPLLKIIWRVENWATSMKLVAEGGANLALMPNKKLSFSALKVEAKLLGFQDYGFYTAAGGELTKQAHVDRLQLRRYPQLLHQNIISNEEHVEYIRFSANYIAVMNNDELCRNLAHVGWGLVPKCFAEQYVKLGLIESFSPDIAENGYKMSIAAYYAPAIKRGPAMTYLLSSLSELASRYYR